MNQLFLAEKELNNNVILILDIPSSNSDSIDQNLLNNYVFNLFTGLKIGINTLASMTSSRENLESLRVSIIIINNNSVEVISPLKSFSLCDIYKHFYNIIRSYSEDCVEYGDDYNKEDTMFLSFSTCYKMLSKDSLKKKSCVLFFSFSEQLYCSDKTRGVIDDITKSSSRSNGEQCSTKITFIRVNNILKSGINSNDSFSLTVPPICSVIECENESIEIKRHFLLSIHFIEKDFDDDFSEIVLLINDDQFGKIFCKVQYEVVEELNLESEKVCPCHNLPVGRVLSSNYGEILCTASQKSLDRNDLVSTLCINNNVSIPICFKGYKKKKNDFDYMSSRNNRNEEISSKVVCRPIKRVPISSVPENLFYGRVGIVCHFEEKYEFNFSSTEKFNNIHKFAALSKYLYKKDECLLMYYIQETIDKNAYNVFKYLFIFGDVTGSVLYLKHVASADQLLPLKKHHVSFDNEITQKVEQMINHIELSSSYSPLDYSSGFHKSLISVIENGEKREKVRNVTKKSSSSSGGYKSQRHHKRNHQSSGRMKITGARKVQKKKKKRYKSLQLNSN